MVHLDAKTRKDLPGASKAFLDPAYTLAGCFNSSQLEATRIKEADVVLNTPSQVALVGDKTKLMRTLRTNQVPTVRSASADSYFNDKKDFLLEDFLADFPVESPEVRVQYRDVNGAREFTDLGDVVKMIQEPRAEGGIFQAVPTLGNVHEVTTLPNARGISLELPATHRTPVTNGVLRHSQFPTSESKEAALKAASDASDALGLSYATVTLVMEPDGEPHILDITTDLSLADAYAIRMYADLVAKKAKSTPKPSGNHKFQHRHKK